MHPPPLVSVSSRLLARSDQDKQGALTLAGEMKGCRGLKGAEMACHGTRWMKERERREEEGLRAGSTTATVLTRHRVTLVCFTLY